MLAKARPKYFGSDENKAGRIPKKPPDEIPSSTNITLSVALFEDKSAKKEFMDGEITLKNSCDINMNITITAEPNMTRKIVYKF